MKKKSEKKIEETVVHDPGNYQKIKEVYLWVSQDKKGNQGILAAQAADGTVMPMVFTDESHRDLLKSIAEKIKIATAIAGKETEFVLLKFTKKELIEKL